MKLYKTIVAVAVLCLVVSVYAFIAAGAEAGIISIVIALALGTVADRIKKKLPQEQPRDRVQELQNVVARKEQKFAEELESIPQVEIVPSRPAERQAVIDMPDISFSRLPDDIDRLFPLVVLDVETTGLDCVKDEIIEVSAIRFVDSFTPESCLTTLCRPLNGIKEAAFAVNGISEDMTADKPTFAEVAPELSSYLAGCNIAGYNVKFDLKFLFAHGVKLRTRAKYYDAYSIARKLISKDEITDYKLNTVCEYKAIFRSGSHRSLSDAYATAKLIEEFTE